MNTLLNGLKVASNMDYTTNGAKMHKSAGSRLYDMFALGGAYRERSEEDCVRLFADAYGEDKIYALRCLFYLRDCRGGQGERRFFRVCFKWLCDNDAPTAMKYLSLLPEYGRWDDMWKATIGTACFTKAMQLVLKQLSLDVQCKTPSLLAKWLPSENASSKETRRLAHVVRVHLGLNHKEYRVLLSKLREQIKVLERLMSAGRWDEIEFDKIPSKAGLVYKNAFARRDVIQRQYAEFMKSDKKVNASVLYPHEVTVQARRASLSNQVDVNACQKYWDNLPNYFDGTDVSMLCMVDTSGSMTWCNSNTQPIDVAVGLGIYCAERATGPFHNHYISFASRPQLIEIRGSNIVDKVRRIVSTNLCDNTNLTAAFDMLLETVVMHRVPQSDMPNTICVISDMQIDGDGWGNKSHVWTESRAITEMEKLHTKWAAHGYKLPHLVYWNVHAVKDTILDLSENVTLVSGYSPVILQQVMTGKTGIDVMYDKLNSSRYAQIR